MIRALLILAQIYPGNLPLDRYRDAAFDDPAARLDRKLATGAAKLEFREGLGYLPSGVGPTAVGSLLRWQLNRGLADLQGAALLTVGLAGAVAWSRGTAGGALRGYLRMVAAEGGHLVAQLAAAGLLAGAGSGLAYVLVLSLPASSWLLSAADGYAHYATLPVG